MKLRLGIKALWSISKKKNIGNKRSKHRIGENVIKEPSSLFFSMPMIFCLKTDCCLRWEIRNFDCTKNIETTFLWILGSYD